MSSRDVFDSLAIAIAVAVVGSCLSHGNVRAGPVFINEIHYDNTGTDAGEAIEIAGLAGTNLTGWNLVLYNGANGQVYDTAPLSGTIPNQSAGFGTLSFSYPVNGLQNGAPDGIALVNSGTVVQFLSYEGTFNAVDGPAAGMSSIDVGVSESSTTPLGSSLQLIGPGREYADFTWYHESPNTFGAVNTDQNFLSSLSSPTDLFISEYVEGSGFVKALELANFTGANIDLAAGNYAILIYSNGSASPTFTIDLAGTVADGDVFVIAHEDSGLAAADATFGNILFNGNDAVALTKGGLPVDVIGQVGVDPGTHWGSGLVRTVDNTLRRKDLIFGGDANGADAFNPFVEWLGYPLDTVDGLGSHAIRTAQVAEPVTLVLLGLGLAGLGLMRRRRAA
jgi:hypothetical protein